eukprot:11914753-Karenia_brevis.AAC.1
MSRHQASSVSARPFQRSRRAVRGAKPWWRDARRVQLQRGHRSVRAEQSVGHCLRDTCPFSFFVSYETAALLHYEAEGC